MSLHSDPEDPALEEACERTRWFEAVLEVEYGEREAEGDIPPELNWLTLLPSQLQLGLEDAECSLAYRSPQGEYRCTVWEVTGEDDRPWLVFLVDDYGARLLPEYSALDEEIEDDQLDIVLARAATELPDRLTAGEFDRSGEPPVIPEWLTRPLPALPAPMDGPP